MMRGLDLGGNFLFHGFFCRVMRVHVFVENVDELRDDSVSLERREQASVNIDGSLRLFKRTGQRNADVGVLRLTRPLTTQPMTASFISSTPTYWPFQPGICSRR